MIKNNEKVIGNIDISKLIINKYIRYDDEILSIDNIGDVKLLKGEYIALDLGEMRNITSIELMGVFNSEDLLIETSVDDVNWNEICKGVCIDLEEIIIAKAVRFTALNDTKLEVYDIEVCMVGEAFRNKYKDLSRKVDFECKGKHHEKKELSAYISELFSRNNNLKYESVIKNQYDNNKDNSDKMNF